MIEGKGAGASAAGSASNAIEFTMKDNRPKDFNKIEIGTPINADTNTIMWDVNPFDLRKLRQRGLLRLVAGTARSEVIAGAHDGKWQDTSGWNASGSLELNAGIIDIVAGGYAEQSDNTCGRSSNASIVGINEKRYSVVLNKDKDPDLYYDCTDKNFRDILDKVAGAKTVADALDWLRRFYQTYGTGFVSQVDLVSYGVYEAVLTRNSKVVQDVFRIGGGIAAAVPFISGKVGGEYLKTHWEDAANTHFAAQAFGQPPDSPPQLWAAAARDRLDGQSIEKFLKGEEWTPPPPEKLTPPDKPKVEPKAIDSSKPLDFPKLPGVFGDAVEFLKHIILGLAATPASQQNLVGGALALTADDDSGQGSGILDLRAAIETRHTELKGYALFTQEDINAEAKLDHVTTFKALSRSDESADGHFSVDGDENPGGGGDDSATSGGGGDNTGGGDGGEKGCVPAAV